MVKIKDFFFGKFSKRFLIRYYLPLMIGSLFFLLLMAYIFYPPNDDYPYHWTTSMISRLGWPHENPIGFIFFSIGFALFGVLVIPLVPYFHRRISEIDKGKANLIALLMIMYSTAFFLIGIIPNYPHPRIFNRIHGINAFFLFFGLYFTAIMFAILILKDDNSVFSRKLTIVYFLILIYGISTLIIGFIFGAMVYRGGQYIHDPSIPLYASPPLWEWQTFIATICLIAIQCIILPE